MQAACGLSCIFQLVSIQSHGEEQPEVYDCIRLGLGPLFTYVFCRDIQGASEKEME